jgi:hypothetical protein
MGSVDVWHIASVLMKSDRRYPPPGDAILADTGGLWPPLGVPKLCLEVLNCLSAHADSALGNLEGESGCRFVVGLGFMPGLLRPARCTVRAHWGPTRVLFQHRSGMRTSGGCKLHGAIPVTKNSSALKYGRLANPGVR